MVPDIFLSAEGGLWVRKSRVQHELKIKIKDLKKSLTIEKAMYRGVKKSKGWSEISVETDEGEPPSLYIRIPRRFLEKAREPPLNLLSGNAYFLPQRLPHTEPGFRLYPYQAVCVDAIMNKLSEEKARQGNALCYFDLLAGRGKTLVGAEVGRIVGERICAIGPRKIIQKQWRDTFRQHCPEYKTDLFRMSKGGLDGLRELDVAIITPAMAMQFLPGTWATFGLVIIDEVHMLCSEEWQQIFGAITSRRVLGLSATTNSRIDGMDKVACWHLGEPLEAKELEDFQVDEVEFFGKVRTVDVSSESIKEVITGVPHQTALSALHDSPSWVQLVLNEVRNLLIIHEEEDLREGRESTTGDDNPAIHNIVVFCENIKAVDIYSREIASLDELRDGVVIAPEIGLVDGENDAVGLRGGVSEEILTVAIERARVIVTTYGYSSVGVSFSRFTAAVMATTRRTPMYQIMARILRINSDTSIRRDYVCLCGPRKSWRDHGGAVRGCSRRLGFDVLKERITID